MSKGTKTNNLNFAIILDDAEFNKRVQKDIQTAKDLNVQLSQLLTVKASVASMSAKEAENTKQLSDNTAKLADNQKKVADSSEKTASSISKATDAQHNLNKSVRQTNQSGEEQLRVFKEAKNLLIGYFSLHGAGHLLQSIARVTGEFELQRTTLAAMIKDLGEAEQIISQIKDLSVKSPFQFKDLTTYAKQLSAFAVSTEELFDTTKMLADISAGLGVGMDRLVLAYGQVKSAAFLRGQEVRQFTEAGIPILEELANQFEALEGRAVSTGEVFDRISARLVPFEMVAKVMKDLTSEGGRFFNMQEVQADTLKGKISNLTDAYEIMLNEIGSSNSGILKGSVDMLRKMMQNWEKIGTIIKSLILTYGSYKGVILAAWAIEKVRNASNKAALIAEQQHIRKSIALYKTLGLSKNAGIGLLIGTVTGAISLITSAIKKATELNREINSIISSSASNSDASASKLDTLVDSLSRATQGSQGYRDIISEINRLYGDYLPKILTEADSYDAVKVAAEGAADAIRNKAQAEAFEKGSQAIRDKYDKDLDGSIEFLTSALLNFDHSITKDAAQEFVKHFNEELKVESESEAPNTMNAFYRAYAKYFGQTYFDVVAIQRKNQGQASHYTIENLNSGIKEYANVMEDVIKAEKKLEEKINNRFTDAKYSSFEERTKVLEIERWYRDELKNNANSLSKLILTQNEYNNAVENLNIEKLKKLVSTYEELGRPEIANKYRKQLEALTKVPDGWRGQIQEMLKGKGLSKHTSFGLWTDETTSSTEYVNNLISRYKELGNEIERVSSFDDAQANRLKENKVLIEEVAHALGIYALLNKEIGEDDKSIGTTESIRIRALKRESDVIKEAMETYQKWMSSGFFTEDLARTLLGKIYNDTQAFKEGVTTYTNEAVEILKESEGCISRIYQNTLTDKNGNKYKDKPTAGYGHVDPTWTSADVGKVIDKEQIEKWLDEDLERLTNDLNDVLHDFGVKLNQAQYDALTHMVFNTGKGGIIDLFKKSLNESGLVDLDKVAENILSHKTNNGTPALLKRRRLEYEMFTKDIGVAVDNTGKIMVNFEEMIERIAIKLSRLGAKGKEAADILRQSIDKSTRGDKANSIYEEYEKSYKAVEKYYKSLKKWATESFELNGDGFIHDLSKIASDLIDGNNKIELKANDIKSLLSNLKLGTKVSIDGIKDKFIKEFGEDAWDEFWKSYEDKGENAINSLAEKEKGYNLKIAQEKVNDLSQKYVKEAYKAYNDKDGAEIKIDFKDLGDKTYKQLRAMRIKLQQLMAQEPLQIPAEVTAQLAGVGVDTSNMANTNLDEAFANLSSMGVDIDDSTKSLIRLTKQLQIAKIDTKKFGEAIKKVFKGDLKNLTDKEIEALCQLATRATKEIMALASSLDELGKATNNEALSNTAKAIGAVADVISDAVNGFAGGGGWIGAVIAGVGSIAEKVLGAVSKSQEALAKVKQAAIDYAHEIDNINFDSLMNSFDTVFGSDSFGKFRAAADEIIRIRKEISNTASTITTADEVEFYNKNSKKDSGLFAGLERPKIREGQFSSDMRTGWQKFWGTGEVVQANINDFFDENGELLGEELRAWYEKYGEGCSDSTKKIIEDMLHDYDQGVKAAEKMTAYLSDIFGKTADDIANAFVDSFKRTGEAFLDTSKMIDNIATNLAKDITKNILLREVFNDDFIKNISKKLMNNDITGAMADVNIAMDLAKELAPTLQAFYEQMQQYFDMNGDAQNLGDGIKGITEDTANLLASYLNAIRADVSFSKFHLNEMNLTMKSILSLLQSYSVPSLLEYQAEIASNTYNNMMHTRNILDRLDSVTTYDGGLPSIRIFS